MFYNGVEWIEYPLISADDEGFSKGYSVYEVFRTYSKQFFALKKNYMRLKKSSDFLGLEVPDINKLVKVLEQAKTLHDFEEYRFKLYITPYTSSIKSFYLFVEEIFDDKEIIDEGVVLNIARERKPHSPVVPYYVKTPLNGFTKYLNKKYDYYYDSLVLNEFGYVTECTYSNVFFVNGGVLVTPYISAGILPGITRENVIELSKSLSIEVEERNVELWELLSAEEVFITHTSRGIVPVRRIYPDFTFSVPGIITDTLLQNWSDFIKDYSDNWKI